MPTNQNQSITQEMYDTLLLTPTTGAPSQVSQTIVPVVNVTPKEVGACSSATTGSAATSGSVGIYAASATRKTFLVGAGLFFSKDATCDTATGIMSLAATVNGVSRNIIALPKLTLTAERQALFAAFKNPILIDKGTTITTTLTFTVGAAVYGGTAHIVETD